MSDEETRIIEKEKQKIAYAEQRLIGLKGRNLEIEKKKIEEEKKVLEEARKNKKAEIKSIEFLDKDGNKKNVFDTRDYISVKISFAHNIDAEPLNFGFTIHSAENSYIFGINTFIDKIDTAEWAKRGYFYLNFKNIPLKTAAYYVTVGIFGDNDSKAYDLLERARSFRIMSTSKSHGSVELDYVWE